MIYTSGHIPITEDIKVTGKVPTEVSVEQAYKAAELCAELTLSTLKSQYDLSLISPVNVVGFVNSDPTFTEHAGVLNGFTDKLSEVFSEKSTRSAVGVASLPLNVCVEVQTIFIINE
jgi:enamine deaminase RidA (YjgF/YER057c/UK114 family)